MQDCPIPYDQAVAYFRFQVISDMLDAPKTLLRATAVELSNKQFNDFANKRMVSFSVRTLFRYYKAYKEHDFDGLRPKGRKDKGTHRSVSVDMISLLLELKKELPSRSACKIITMLVLARKVDEGTLHVRTVNRILNTYGYTRKSLSADTRVYVKHEKDRINEMWQSDVMNACYIPDGNGGMAMAYLIGIIDDHSRRILHSEFYLDSTLPRLEDTLRKSVTKFGAPSSLYVDNGKIYIAQQFKLICARLGIRLRYATPYHPAGKGKIEKFWQYVQSSFLPEIKLHPVDSLSALNDLFFAWLDLEYTKKHHTGIEMSPKARWDASLENGTTLRYFSPLEFDAIFLHATERTVNKYGVVSFEGNTYEAPGELVLQKVTLRYNPFHLDYIHIYFKDKYFGVAKLIDLATQRHKSVGLIPEESGYDSEISRLYLENIKSNYHLYLKDQLAMAIEPSAVATHDLDTTPPDDDDASSHPMKPKKDLEFVISSSEFIEIVKASIGASELTFQEKSKLFELWSTFKEFNKEILTAILADLASKSTDFNQNFLFYISQIRNLYLEKISILEDVYE